MATDIPHVDFKSVASSAAQNELIDRVNSHDADIITNSSDISALDSRVTTAEGGINTNSSDIGGLDTRVTSLEATSHPIRTQATDTELYGDIVNSHRRGDCYHSEVLSNGFMTAFACISPKTFTANELRLCVTGAGSSPGTFDIGFYKGSSLSNLVQQFTSFGSELVDTTGMLILPFDSGISVSEGDYIAVEMIATNWGTSPEFSSTPTGPNAQLLMNDTPYSVYEGSRSYPLDDPIDFTATTWSLSNQSYWFALA
ncbi:hypothetical protein [Actinopolyspora erythraea]|uniref:hypothetical protein n=1 Tax=Actinopolyspora erythraea TaxID=414996 RepID=UPI00118714E0|nr:hypothetical protein [Actinopolyspora erythraea]